MSGCGKATEKSLHWDGDPIPCGTKLTFGTGKQPRRTVIHLCDTCEKKESSNGEATTAS